MQKLHMHCLSGDLPMYVCVCIYVFALIKKNQPISLENSRGTLQFIIAFKASYRFNSN